MGIFIQLLILLSALGLSGCMSLLYAPRMGPVLIYDPKRVNVEPEDVWLDSGEGENGDREKWHAWYLPTPEKKSKGIFVHFHGNAENLTSHYAMTLWVRDWGYDLLIFDYPGYGLSEGEPTPRATVKAGVKALEWAHQKAAGRPVIVYGQSLGGIIAIAAAVEVKNQIPLCDVILDSTFASYQGVARRKLAARWWSWPLQPLAYLLMSDKEARDPASLAPTPTLVIHSRQDRVVEFPNGEDLFLRLRDPKDFWILDEGDHSATFRIKDQDLRSRLAQRLEKTCPF